MRLKSRLSASRTLIDLTPLVDVIFLLLIFFMITADIRPLKSLDIEHPTLNRESDPLTAQLLVVMDAQEVVYLGSEREIVGLYSLKDRLDERIESLRAQHLGSDPTVVLSVDRRVDYGAFLRLFSTAQECATTVRLVYKSEGISGKKSVTDGSQHGVM